MTSDISDWTGQVHQGDAVEVMNRMPEKSVDCCVTSPPFWGLRDYQTKGQIGLEDTPGEYVKTMVDVGRAVHRVLKDTGTWWLNLGDTYAGGGGISGVPDDWDSPSTDNREKYPDSVPARDTEFPDKCKLLVPHRVAIALIDDGWICRNDAVWAKKNPMPESVTDRLSTTFEFFFLFSKEGRYYLDLDSIREPHADSSKEKVKYGFEASIDAHPGEIYQDESRKNPQNFDTPLHPNGKNPGDVFEVSVKPFSKAHFATFPPDLIEDPIKASCPWKICSKCGIPYERDREVTDREVAGGSPDVPEEDRGKFSEIQGQSHSDRDGLTQPVNVKLGEWEKQCGCVTDDTQPGIVLDPFMGSGTTAVVAENLQRRWVGIDLKKDYVEMAEDRIGEETDINVNPISEW